MLETLAADGAEIINVFPQYRSIRASVPLDRLESIASLPGVIFIQPRLEARTWGSARSSGAGYESSWRRFWSPNFAERAARVHDFLSEALRMRGQDRNLSPNIGSRNSEGDATHRANTARSTYGFNGAGVRIGVISDGVVNLAASQALGDLPSNVTVLPGQKGTGDEGTAMLEIIHDLAPSAQLFFATAFNGIASFAQNIRDLRAAGCDIIVDDVIYFVETPFHDGQTAGVTSNTNGGIVTQAVNDVTAAGALYFSSAGNAGNKNDNTAGVFEGDFVDGGPNPLLGTGVVHNFGGGVLYDTITANGGPGNLFWADPLGASGNDYDLFVLNSTGTAIVAASTSFQTGTQDPFEQVSSSSIVTNNRMVVLKFSGAARYFHMTTNGARLSISTPGVTRGHACAANAYGIAATPAIAPGPFPNPFNSANMVENFSSDGPRRVFFFPNGTPITPGDFSSTGGLLRQKPDITAADKVSVTGVGGFPSIFSGTSAAAPHAAAIAALLKSASPSLTPAQLRTTLTATAIDIEAPGVDRDSGAGIVMAFEALQSIGASPSANFEAGTITIAEAGGNGNGVIEPGESATLTVQLRNTGVVNATGITATLTINTAGVTVTQGASAYPNLPAPTGSANNVTPFGFTLSSTAACPLRIAFNLSVAYTGGPSPRLTTFNVLTGPPPLTITSTLDSLPPAPGPGFTTTTGLQSPRLNRDGIASACGGAKPCPGAFSSGTRQYDAYTFTNCATNATACVTVTLSTACTGATNNLFSTAYLGSFDPNSLCTNYRADMGSSPGTIGTLSYSFNVPAGAAFTVVVHETNSGGGLGCGYTLNIDGLCCQTGCPTIAVNPPAPTLPGGTAGTPYNQTLTATGGTAPYTFTVSAGTLPPGLNLSSGGLLSGTPTQTGSFSFTVKATDANGCMGIQGYTVIISLPPPPGSWNPQPSGTTNFLNDVHFLNENVGWVAGAQATLLKTTDGGTNWMPPPGNPGVPAANGFNSVRFIDQNLGWAGGLYSVIRTENGGSSWTTRLFPTTNFRNSHFPVSSTVAWAVGGGTVSGQNCRSFFRNTFTGAGINEEIWNFCPSGLLSDVYFIDPDNGWAVGSSGQIYRITNASAPTPTFTPQPSGTTNALRGVQMLDASTGWIVGASGTILKTTNGGGMWTLLSSGTSVNLTEVHFVNANLGGVVGESGLIRVTADGGASWAPDPSGVTVELGGVHFANANVGYAVGASGTILKRTTCTTTITVNPTDPNLPQGTVGVPYSQTFTASGGTSPHTFSVSAGMLPPGLNLSPGGVLSGTPMQAGNFQFTVRATESGGVCSGERQYTLPIICPAITVNPLTVPDGFVGQVYPPQTFTGSGGMPPYTCMISAGTLPPGMTLVNCVLSGTPTQLGTFSFTVKLTDSKGCTGERQYTLNVPCPTITVNPTNPNLPPGTAGVPYSQTFTATGGTAPYTFSVSGGSLPAGLTLSSSGTLSGTPSQCGTFNFTIMATDNFTCMATRSYMLVINGPTITISPPTLPNGSVGTPYNQTLTASGGAAPYSFSISAGTLPPGLALSSTGEITGTPTTAGSFPFTVKATDSNGCMGMRNYTIVISGAGLVFYPLMQPVRLLDTRPGESACFNPGAPLGNDAVRTQPAVGTCFGATIPPTATAIVGNATVVNFISSGFHWITLYPSDAMQPNASNLNFTDNEIVPNNFTVGLGPDGAFKIYSHAATHFIVDIIGYYAPPTTGGLYYHPLPAPVRLFDSRPGENACDAPGAPLSTDGTRTVMAHGACLGATIPASAKAIVGNATVVNFISTGFHWITLYPFGASLPIASNLNFHENHIVPNWFVVKLSPDGKFNVYSHASTHFIVDVAGYFSEEQIDVNGQGLLYTALSKPVRLLDTRPNELACDAPGVPLGNDAMRTQTAHRTCFGETIPNSAKAVVGNATVVNFISTGFHWITLYPSGVPQPNASNLNFMQNQIVPNAFWVGLSSDGKFNIYSHASTHFIVDLTGYFAP